MFVRKWIKWLLGFAGIVIAVSAVVIFSCDWLVRHNAEGRLYDDYAMVPEHEAGLLLGTSPLTRIGRLPNRFFTFRIDAADALYKAGKIRKILISGDENSLDGINEVECMRDSLVNRGVDSDDIILDGKGFRTQDSVEHAGKIYGVKDFVVISQKFHNERALYIADQMGLESCKVDGFNAKDAKSRMAMLTYLREYLARVKMFVDFVNL